MTAIEAQAVSKQFFLRHNRSIELKVRFLGLLHPEKRETIEEFWALRGVSFHIERGESVGLIGRNGSGKSTLLKLIAAIHRPTNGRLLVARGARIGSMIELGVGFHPELTGRENIFLNAAIHGLTRGQIEDIYAGVVAYSGLEHFIDVPIKNYSSGMYMRLGFSIAANLDPDILLLDEIFAVGDADFQLKCTETMRQFLEAGKTIIFVSHGADAVRAICRRVCVLEQGELTFDGDVEEGLAFYAHSLSVPPDHGSSVSGHAPDSADLDRAPHRNALGGRWTETGQWQFDFLRQQGLEPRHHLLEVGCGDLASAIHLIPFLDEDHYWGVERHQALLDTSIDIELPRAGIAPERAHFVVDEHLTLDQVPGEFDYALATSLFAYLPFNGVARTIASVVRKLKPSGRFFASWFENADLGNFEPIARPSGGTTHADREPYHYPFSLIAAVCDSVGATVERVADATTPRDESVLVITRR